MKPNIKCYRTRDVMHFAAWLEETGWGVHTWSDAICGNVFVGVGSFDSLSEAQLRQSLPTSHGD